VEKGQRKAEDIKNKRIDRMRKEEDAENSEVQNFTEGKCAGTDKQYMLVLFGVQDTYAIQLMKWLR
jgi:hypothetical protein